MPIRPEHLKNSERGGDMGGDRPGLGKVILMLLKHPQEILENKKSLQGLLEEWSRQIFNKSKDFKQLPRSLKESAPAPKNRLDPASLATDLPEDFGGGMGAAIAAAADLERVKCPVRVGFDFKIRPVAPTLEAATTGKKHAKKIKLQVKMKEQARKLASSGLRGEAPLHRLD
jgi:transcription factor SPN1